MNRVIKASAGTGKTHRLVEDIAERVTKDGIDPAQIIAVTFTEKAAAELKTRIRSRLSQENRYEEAAQIDNAMIGTVHSVCNTLVRRFPVESGTSPDAEVISKADADILFRQALSSVYESIADEELETVQRRLDPELKKSVTVFAKKIADQALTNGIKADQLEAMAQQSIAALAETLGPAANESSEALHTTWIAAIRKTAAEAEQIIAEGKAPALSVTYLEKIRDLSSRLSGGSFIWNDLSSAAEAASGAKLKEQAAALKSVLMTHLNDPLFRSDMQTYIRAVFRIAAESMQTYDAVKRSHALIDYNDMERRTLTLLKNPLIINALKSEFKILYVDEFQDTSPLQLAIFMRLGAVIGQMIWVGDRKQSIYGFRGADPDLTDKAYAMVIKRGGMPETLQTSYRTRPDLVEIFNTVFVPHFTAKGYEAEEVRMNADRKADKGLPASPMELWLGAKEKTGNTGDAEQVQALAEGIKNLLQTGMRVYDRKCKGTRPLTKSDIAVLCLSNSQVSKLAQELEEQGVRCSFKKSGLFKTHEGSFILAALAFILDKNAMYEQLLLSYLEKGGRPDAHLTACTQSAPSEASETLRTLGSIRDGMSELTPAEVLRRIISDTPLRSLCIRWGEAPQRLMNIDAICALAENYASSASVHGTGVSIPGLYKALRSSAENEDPEEAGQGMPSDIDAVNLLTYHRSKGLEWPIVILYGMFDKYKVKPSQGFFDSVHVVSETAPDPQDMLKNRSLLFLPWPYSPKTEKCRLAEIFAQNSLLHRDIDRKLKEERERLIYVGMTRAMDLLVLTGKEKLIQLETKKPAEEVIANLELVTEPLKLAGSPTGENIPLMLSGSRTIRSAVRTLGTTGPLNTSAERKPRWFNDTAAGAAEAVPYRLSPSLLEAGSTHAVFSIVSKGTPFPIRVKSAHDTEDDNSVFGTMVHDFFAGDSFVRSRDERIAHAKRLIDSRIPDEQIDPAMMIASHDALKAFLEARHSHWRTFREMPVRCHENGQLISGIADLVLSDGTSFVLVDYKTFGGSHDACVKRSEEYASQLQAYAKGLTAASGERCAGIYLYYAAANCIVECTGIA